MLNVNDITLFSTVSFDLYPAALVAPSYKYAKVLGVMDADTARLFVDTVASHANVYPTLPEGTPNNHNQYPWVKLKLASNVITAVGLPWIKEETYVTHTTTTIRLTIENVEPANQNLIIECLAANGFSAVNVEVIT